jgi:hypothetical protein
VNSAANPAQPGGTKVLQHSAADSPPSAVAGPQVVDTQLGPLAAHVAEMNKRIADTQIGPFATRLAEMSKLAVGVKIGPFATQFAAVKSIDLGRFTSVLDPEIAEWAASALPLAIDDAEQEVSDQLRTQIDIVRLWLMCLIAKLGTGATKLNAIVDAANDQLSRYQQLVINLLWLYGAVTLIRQFLL